MKASRVSVGPGRSIASPFMATLYGVGAVKDTNLAKEFARHYITVDGGMVDSIRLALYGACYTATFVSRVSDAELVRSRVVGKYRESGDIVVWGVDLSSDVRAGDLPAVLVIGACGYSMASNYNMLMKPSMVVVEDGATGWIMRPWTAEGLLALDPGPD